MQILGKHPIAQILRALSIGYVIIIIFTWIFAGFSTSDIFGLFPPILVGALAHNHIKKNK